MDSVKEVFTYKANGVIEIEYRDLKTQYLRYKKEIDTAIQEVLLNSTFIGGKEVEELEEQLADYIGVKRCISCANGTDAMTLVMMAWDIKAGDAIFVPDFTFFSTGEVVALQGATPIFVDVNKDTFTMDPSKLEEAIEHTLKEGTLTAKAILPVDLFGLPADHLAIKKVAQKYKLKILEDGAQGFGASINGQKACSFGDAASTSFFPAKPLGCYGDGGAIFTNNDELAEVILSLKNHGKGIHKYHNVRIGINSRLDTLQAAILKVKLKAFIADEIKAVNEIYRYYSQRLIDIVEIPVIPEGYYSSFAQYTIKLKDEQQRNSLQKSLKENGIPSMVYYPVPMHQQKAFQMMSINETLGTQYDVTNQLSKTVLSLPMHPYLTEKDVDGVCSVIKSILSL